MARAFYAFTNRMHMLLVYQLYGIVCHYINVAKTNALGMMSIHCTLAPFRKGAKRGALSNVMYIVAFKNIQNSWCCILIICILPKVFIYKLYFICLASKLWNIQRVHARMTIFHLPCWTTLQICCLVVCTHLRYSTWKCLAKNMLKVIDESFANAIKLYFALRVRPVHGSVSFCMSSCGPTHKLSRHPNFP